ncbi:hypothetical protein BDR06DRAFT_963504 [Suillus hirtellus]|nr:hypothetical protein BDR06DRAFT_963504 [Suillus hirtellus]
MPTGRQTPGSGRGPPKSNSLIPSNGPNTWRTTRTNISLEEIIATPNNIMDTDSAEKFLASKLLYHGGQPYTLTHLISILFHITQMSSVTLVPVTAAIRAVASPVHGRVILNHV